MAAEVFRADWEANVFHAGTRRYYPSRMHRENLPEDNPAMHEFAREHSRFRMWSRHVWIPFENRWQLSVMWSDSSYSSNYWLLERGPFVEDPWDVEVGVLTPDSRPAAFAMGETWLLGDPLAHVDVPTFNEVATLVSCFPSGEEIPEPDWDDARGFCDWARVWGLAFNDKHY